MAVENLPKGAKGLRDLLDQFEANEGLVHGDLTVEGTLFATALSVSLLTLDASQIVSGVLDVARIPSLDASKIGSGTFVDARIPSLDASKVTSGQFAAARIPSLDAAIINSGQFAAARIPNLDASILTSGVLDVARIPSLDASKVTSGLFAAARIPNLDASIITSGQFADARLAALSTSKLVGTITDAQLATPYLKADGSRALTGDLSAGGHKLTGLADPTAAGDAASKSYVDAVAQGLQVKSPVAAATTANIVLSGEQTIDGVVTSASRVLVKNQTTQTENGIYVTGAGAWTRATDADAGSELVQAFVFVSGGTVNQKTGWTQTTPGPITIGVTNIVWSQFSAAGVYAAGIGLTLTGTVFDVQTDGSTLEPAGGAGSALRIKDLGVTTAKLAALAVTTAKLDDLSVTTGKIANAAVDLTTKVTGQLPNANIATGLDAAKVASVAGSTLPTNVIPSLDASIIGSGTFATARIPSLDASKVTSGTFDVARIPDLDAAKVTSGSFATGRIPNLDASKITSGTFATGRIPSLDASIITTGTFGTTFIADGAITTPKLADGAITNLKLSKAALLPDATRVLIYGDGADGDKTNPSGTDLNATLGDLSGTITKRYNNLTLSTKPVFNAGLLVILVKDTLTINAGGGFDQSKHGASGGAQPTSDVSGASGNNGSAGYFNPGGSGGNGGSYGVGVGQTGGAGGVGGGATYSGAIDYLTKTARFLTGVNILSQLISLLGTDAAGAGGASGGNGASTNSASQSPGRGGRGGAGGGDVIIIARRLVFNATPTFDVFGEQGGDGTSSGGNIDGLNESGGGGCGGGGSGGRFVLLYESLTLNSGAVMPTPNVAGGAHGTTVGQGKTLTANGHNGSHGTDGVAGAYYIAQLTG